MSDSNITKQALANALKALMLKKTLNKISVGDIVNECKLTRQTFYYHFKDKYDLMNWIYYTETARFMDSYHTIENWTDGLVELCYYMQENKSFFSNALKTVGQNSFPEYLQNYIHDITLSVVDKMKGDKEIDSKEWAFIVDFCSIAFVGSIVRWSKNGMLEDPKDYITQMKKLVDGSMLQKLYAPDLQ